MVEASFEKEYGQDYFQMQSDAVKKGQTVLVVDDIIATGRLHNFTSECQFRMGQSANHVSQGGLPQLLEHLSNNLVEIWLDTYSFSNSTS